MRVGRTHLLALAAGGCLCLGALGFAARDAAEAAPSRNAATNGLILFQANVGYTPQIFTIRPDGSGLKQITKIPFKEDTPGAEQADWSPDGKTIAFDAASAKGGSTIINVFTVAPDGSALSELPLAVPGYNGAPSYSPDGTKIAFDQDAGSAKPTVHGIFVANADGSDPHRLTTGIATKDAYDTKADWSPDGKQITFTRVKSKTEAAIFVVRTDGSGLKQLTPWKLDAAGAAWSPDGSKLVFQTYYDSQLGKSPNIFTMRPTGGKMIALTHFTGGDVQALGPAWSPDGTKIVWHKLSPAVDQLFIMDAHGGHVRKLTKMPRGSTPSRAAWGTAAG
jgi:Tol biopolymer transport system component